MTYTFETELWEYNGPDAWTFASLPKTIAAEIKEVHGTNARGFGSLKVSVTIGKTVWQTSIFPDNKAGAYFLPIKKEVRRAESLQNGSKTTVSLTIL